MPKIDAKKLATLQGEELLSTLEQDAVKNGISDIHITPQKNCVKVEWRELGLLQKLLDISHETFETMRRRIKFKSKLKLNVDTIAQDGQYTFAADSRFVNVRVATLPTRFGEKLTLRMLDPQHGIIALSKLGIAPEVEKALAELVQLPNGLVLVTGPTGSGKTTTLYALLATIIGKSRNIITLEDPIEYEIAGITQSEINPDRDYNFSNGLRSILRHDPDVILVGEIRDLETAQMAVNASLTGHLVLSTLHTNSAPESIQRLLSMGVSPYTLAPALRAILAQRLIRTLAEPYSKGAPVTDPSDPKIFGGQTAVTELLLVTPAIQKLILNLESTEAIVTEAKKEGFITMRERADALIAAKLTLREEVARVIS